MKKIEITNKIGIYQAGIIDEDGIIVDDKYLDDLNKLMDSQKRNRFYKRKSWRSIRNLVLEFYSNKCQLNAEGCLSKATIVHHVELLKFNSKFAFSPYIGENTQLAPVCVRCHSLLHPSHLPGDVNEELNDKLRFLTKL